MLWYLFMQRLRNLLFSVVNVRLGLHADTDEKLREGKHINPSKLITSASLCKAKVSLNESYLMSKQPLGTSGRRPSVSQAGAWLRAAHQDTQRLQATVENCLSLIFFFLNTTLILIQTQNLTPHMGSLFHTIWNTRLQWPSWSLRDSLGRNAQARTFWVPSPAFLLTSSSQGRSPASVHPPHLVLYTGLILPQEWSSLQPTRSPEGQREAILLQRTLV